MGLANGWINRHNRHLFDGRSAVHATAAPCLRRADGSDPIKGWQRRRDHSFSSVDDLAFSHHWNRQHCRGGWSYRRWRTWGRVLDVDYCHLWHCHQIRRSRSGGEVSRNRWIGKPRRRPDVLHPKWPWFPMELVSRPVCSVRHARGLWHRQRCSGLRSVVSTRERRSSKAGHRRRSGSLCLCSCDRRHSAHRNGRLHVGAIDVCSLHRGMFGAADLERLRGSQCIWNHL